jgi:hypothetical protein
MLGKIFITLLFLVSFSGCGTTTFGDPSTNPVIEDAVGRWFQETVGTLAVKADRRIIVVRLDKEARFCAEPPPDVAENLTKELAVVMEAQAKAPQSGIGGSGKLDLKDNLTTKIQELVKRTQGVDIYRTGMYALCQHFLNEGLTPSDLRASSDQLLITARELILKELEFNANAKTATAQAAIFAQSKEK